MTGAEWFEAGKALVSIGLAVYQAFASGEKDLTVGEIMAGRESELAHIEALDARAVLRYAARMTRFGPGAKAIGKLAAAIAVEERAPDGSGDLGTEPSAPVG